MIGSDPKLKETVALVKARALLPLKKYLDEAIEILGSLPAPKPHSRSIISLRMKMANKRSELIGRRLIIARELAQLRQLQSDLSDYLLARYNTGYLGNIKNARSREAVINQALQPILERVSNLEAALESVNTVIGDLDSKAFAVRDIMEALKLGERESHE